MERVGRHSSSPVTSCAYVRTCACVRVRVCLCKYFQGEELCGEGEEERERDGRRHCAHTLSRSRTHASMATQASGRQSRPSQRCSTTVTSGRCWWSSHHRFGSAGWMSWRSGWLDPSVSTRPPPFSPHSPNSHFRFRFRSELHCRSFDRPIDCVPLHHTSTMVCTIVPSSNHAVVILVEPPNHSLSVLTR